MNIKFYDPEDFFKGRGSVRGEIFGEKRAGKKKCGFSGKNIMSDILGMLQEVDLLTDGVSLSPKKPLDVHPYSNSNVFLSVIEK